MQCQLLSHMVILYILTSLTCFKMKLGGSILKMMLLIINIILHQYASYVKTTNRQRQVTQRK